MYNDFSVILPVHNEERMLSKTFQCICSLNPSEIIIILDRCTDRSEKICRLYANKFRIKFIKVDKKSGWFIHLNWLYVIGIKAASCSIVFLSQADIALDAPKIIKNLKYAAESIISFRHIPYLDRSTPAILLLSKLPLMERLSSVFAFPREWLFKYKLIENLEIPFDTQIGIKISKFNLPYRYINTNSWNLRYPGPRSRLYDIGRTMRIIGRSHIFTLLKSIVRLQPEIYLGYIKAGKAFRSHQVPYAT